MMPKGKVMRNDVHLSDMEKRLYLNYLSGCLDEPVDLEYIFDIQRHISECEKCSKEMQRLLALSKGIRELDFTKIAETAQRAKLLKALRMKQSTLDDDKSVAFIERLIDRGVAGFENAVAVVIEQEVSDKQVVSRLVINDSDDTLRYERLSQSTRSEDHVASFADFTKVVTSKRIKHKTEVSLDGESRVLRVKLKKEDVPFNPRMALIRYDVKNMDDSHVIVKEPQLNADQDVYEYVFDNLERGNYFLFIEPLLMV